MSELALLSKPVLMRRLALVPAVASASLAANRQGAFDTPFEPARTAEAVAQAGHKVAAFTVAPLLSQRDGAPYLMAAETEVVPSLVIYSSGLEALPIGGLTGTIPSPTRASCKPTSGPAGSTWSGSPPIPTPG